MQNFDQDVLTQYEKLSKAAELIFMVSRQTFEGNQTYQELKSIRKQLEEKEKNFPKPKKLNFALSGF
ncbi:MAG: hypothetical protein JST21_17740 [Bacteroidetes bacterium]|nr:hypothetical protein [Bacteroidota bacterium]